MRPADLQFVIDEIMQGARVLQMARHKFGCRILQRLLENCRHDQMASIIDIILSRALACSQHMYANYVMQHVCEFGSLAQQRYVAELLAQHAPIVAEDTFAASVAEMIFIHAEKDCAVSLAMGLLTKEGVVSWMSHSRRGHAAVKAMLCILKGADLDIACKQILSNRTYHTTRYGRSIASLAKGLSEGRCGKDKAGNTLDAVCNVNDCDE